MRDKKKSILKREKQNENLQLHVHCRGTSAGRVPSPEARGGGGREEETAARSPQASEAGVPPGQKGPRDGSPGHAGTFGTYIFFYFQGEAIGFC